MGDMNAILRILHNGHCNPLSNLSVVFNTVCRRNKEEVDVNNKAVSEESYYLDNMQCIEREDSMSSLGAIYMLRLGRSMDELQKSCESVAVTVDWPTQGSSQGGNFGT